MNLALETFFVNEQKDIIREEHKERQGAETEVEESVLIQISVVQLIPIEHEQYPDFDATCVMKFLTYAADYPLVGGLVCKFY